MVLRAVGSGEGTRADRFAAAWTKVGALRSGDERADAECAANDAEVTSRRWSSMPDAEMEQVIERVIRLHWRLVELRNE